VTPEESIEYFVEYFEKWRKVFSKVISKEVTDFILMGHSFGGYICGNYAVKYHHHLRKLILISSIGIRVKEPGESEFGRVMDKMKEARDQGIKPPPLWAKLMLKFAWARKITPF
jgi:pimeloyl-ACP methyl ester carboxylesterase